MSDVQTSLSGFTFVPDPKGMNELLRSESGATVRYLLSLGDRVQSNARNRVPIGKNDPVPRRNPRRPGTLRASIVKRLAYQGGDPVVVVGVFSGPASKYALYVHEGTVSHPIRAKGNGRLVFYWPRVGAVVYVRAVQHPGTKPQRFLTEALAEELRR